MNWEGNSWNLSLTISKVLRHILCVLKRVIKCSGHKGHSVSKEAPEVLVSGHRMPLCGEYGGHPWVSLVGAARTVLQEGTICVRDIGNSNPQTEPCILVIKPSNMSCRKPSWEKCQDHRRLLCGPEVQGWRSTKHGGFSSRNGDTVWLVFWSCACEWHLQDACAQLSTPEKTQELSQWVQQRGLPPIPSLREASCSVLQLWQYSLITEFWKTAAIWNSPVCPVVIWETLKVAQFINYLIWNVYRVTPYSFREKRSPLPPIPQW